MSRCTLCGTIPPEGEPMMASPTMDETKRDLCMRCASIEMANKYLENINRIELINYLNPIETRTVTVWEMLPIDVKLSVQDDGRTLKIFVSQNPDKL